MIEFGVDGEVTKGDDCVFVTGRCYHGPIAVGDVFDLAYQYIHRKTPQDSGPPMRVGERSVLLRVEGIQTHHQAFQKIDSGDTALLRLCGAGTKSLRQGDVLGISGKGPKGVGTAEKMALRMSRPIFNRTANGTPRWVCLDNNATTPVDPRVLERMLPFLSRAHGNPASRDHAFGWEAADAVEEARTHVAALINASPADIFVTSGATESANLTVKGLSLSPNAVATFATEHEAVLGPCRQLKGTAVRYLRIDREGRIGVEQLGALLEKEPCGLVALMLANNETGVIHPVREVARVARDAGALFFSDITQAAGKIPIDVRAMGIDLAAFSAHKMYGPKGVGALFVRGGEPKIELEPLIVGGGGQERGLRGGTLNVPAIVGFGEACHIAQLEMKDEAERVGKLRDKLEQALLAELPDIWIDGDRANRLYNTSNIGFAGVDARTLIRDMHDIAVSTRSACSSSSQGPSHVLKAMGLTDEQAYSCVRFSLGRFTTEEEIDYTIQKVIASVTKLRKR